MMNNLSTKMTTTKAPTMTTETKITARDVQVYYGEKQALRDVNIEIRPRSVTAFTKISAAYRSLSAQGVTPRFVGYVRAVTRRYDELAPLGRLFDELEGVAHKVGYTF